MLRGLLYTDLPFYQFPYEYICALGVNLVKYYSNSRQSKINDRHLETKNGSVSLLHIIKSCLIVYSERYSSFPLCWVALAQIIAWRLYARNN